MEEGLQGREGGAPEGEVGRFVKGFEKKKDPKKGDNYLKTT
jgi:hypothetical protein